MARITIGRLEHSEQSLSAEDASQVIGAGVYFWGGLPTTVTPWGMYSGGGRVYTPFVPYPAVYPAVGFYGAYPVVPPMFGPVYGHYGP